ncbi:hypothetical protein GK1943 [Geobacillus kaustophilus HTA426]|uniref:Uncharacterized protein n=1 Tax=Geobacillus kaustophilus (strain HTA426) TaxID=235909 RepID=Q5KYK8_GEOKA|nr:hypothetical protein GK1943 [Geobacillus kaustophilus HTA426]
MFAILFQSLIGTIKTAETIEPAETAEPVSIPHRYDKNSFVTRKTPAYFLFQSLIGTIKTKSIATIGSRIERNYSART